jgi:transcriptional regulator with XRE-family HTH domain
MTLNERFAAWLADAMRAAGMDIDRQRGGGRMTLATKLGASPSSVARWLDGKATPSPEFYEPLAEALGVPVGNMLIETGILSSESLLHPRQTGVRSQPITAAQAADQLGIHDPDERAGFIRDVERRVRRLRPAESEGGAGGAVAT